MADLKAILESAITPTGETSAQVSLFDQIKTFGYGYPLTEIILRGYSDGWATIGRALADVGVEEDFVGILVNGRVSVILIFLYCRLERRGICVHIIENLWACMFWR